MTKILIITFYPSSDLFLFIFSSANNSIEASFSLRPLLYLNEIREELQQSSSQENSKFIENISNLMNNMSYYQYPEYETENIFLESGKFWSEKDICNEAKSPLIKWQESFFSVQDSYFNGKLPNNNSWDN